MSHSHPEADADAEVEVKLYTNQADAELEDQRPATPSTPEHEQNDHDQADFHGGADSLDDDSSSDYINNTSDDEEDYDDGMMLIMWMINLCILSGIIRKILSLPLR